MLDYNVAFQKYEEIKKKNAECENVHIQELYVDFLKEAVEYANIRTKWSFMDMDAKREVDSIRTAHHNSFIGLLTAICRNLEVKEIEDIMPDRKTKGDFACYIAAFLGIEQR